jgi:two-component system cell cycle sensor histidine kinase/response regulator CckA
VPDLELVRPTLKALPVEFFEAWPDPIACVHGGLLTYVNKALVQYLGYGSARDFEGHAVLDFIHPDDRKLTAERMDAALLGGMPNPALERKLLRRDGTMVTAEVSSAVYGTGDSASLVIVLRDVTRRALRTETILNDRSSLSTLAAGIAHEINNPLAYLMTNLEFAGEEISRTRRLLSASGAGLAQIPGGQSLMLSVPRLMEVEESLSDALGGAERVRQIVKNLRMLSRDESVRIQPLDLATAVDASLEIMANEIRHRAKLVRQAQDTPLVEVNQTQLCQVLVNILTNAVQAIEKGTAQENEIKIVTGTDARGWAFVEIRDTGVGISPDVADRMFDLFFTTKPQGTGQGLGLSISHALVNGMGGEIFAGHNGPRGATFRVSLPPAALRTSKAEPALTKRRILIVDDEAGICSSLRRILGTPYETETTTRAFEALELIRSGERYDLILCDLMMPDLTGMELHRELQKLAPDQADRMIFLTGGAFTPGAREFLEETKNLRVDKPFNKEALRALVAERLGVGGGA